MGAKWFGLDFWPAGVVLGIAVVAVAALRLVERYADVSVARRTRRALDRVLGETRSDDATE